MWKYTLNLYKSEFGTFFAKKVVLNLALISTVVDSVCKGVHCVCRINICGLNWESQPELSFVSDYFSNWQSNMTNEKLSALKDGLISALLYAMLLLLPQTHLNIRPGHIKCCPMMSCFHFKLFQQPSSDDVDLEVGSEPHSALPHGAPFFANLPVVIRQLQMSLASSGVHRLSTEQGWKWKRSTFV